MTTLAAQHAPPPLPHPALSSGSPLRAALTAGFVVLLLAFPLLVTALVTPKFMDIFKDFGVALSLPTRLFLDLGMALTTPVGAALAMMVIGMAAALVALWSYRRLAGTVVSFVIALLFFVFYMLALVTTMYTPLVTMIESLQQSKP